MVFDEELDEALNADLFKSTVGLARSADELVAAVLAAEPGTYVSSLSLSKEPGDSALAYFKHAGPETAGHVHGVSTQVFIDPVTASVIGVREREGIDLSRRGIMHFIVNLHYKLQLGDTGKWLFGLVALLWVVDHIPAVLLSFPSAAKWKQSFAIRTRTNAAKLTFDLHRAIGLWLLPVTLVLAVSSVYLNWGTEFRAVVGMASPLSKRFDETAPSLAEPNYFAPVSFQEAIDAASSNLPGAIVDGMSFIPAKGLYRVRFFDQHDVDPTVGRRYVYVDARSGKVLADEHIAGERASASDLVLAWQFPLHSGKAFGWTGRIVILFAGLAVSVFAVTGLLIWARKLRARQHVKTRPGELPTTPVLQR